MKRSLCLCLLLGGSVCLSNWLAEAAPAGLRVAIYSGTGAESDKTLALYRAVAACGHTPLAIIKSDIVNGRLTPTNFPVFIIPAGEGGQWANAGDYSDTNNLGAPEEDLAIRNYLAAGGGVVAIEAGAYYGSHNGATLGIYGGDYNATQPVAGKQTFTIVASAFGSGPQEIWLDSGGGYFSSTPVNATVIATDTNSRPVAVCAPYGAGRVALCTFDPELRGDSEDDWTLWDNWAMGGQHSNSIGCWVLLGRMIGWAATGDSSAPIINSTPNLSGARVAVVTSHTSDGGAWPGLLPGLARAIEFSGHVPLAIRFDEIIQGRLTTNNFKVVTFPGGYAYGYKTGLAGSESSIRNFISAGGSYYGICAGSFYAGATLDWYGANYSYPLGILASGDAGPIDDIIPWPGYALTPVAINDPVIGNLGTIQQFYYGGGYHVIPTDVQQGAHVFTVATFAYGGSASNLANTVRYTYGQGRVLLVNTHAEVRAGSDVDWMAWDNYDYTIGLQPLINPDNPWLFVSAAFNNWLVPGIPRSSGVVAGAVGSLDSGGQRVASASYTMDSSIGGIGGISSAPSHVVIARHGYTGQLYDVAILQLNASPNAVNEGGNCQLSAVAVLDDTTLLPLPASSVIWSAFSWPITSINASGLLTTTNVYQDTVATVDALYQSKTGILSLTVLNVDDDDFGIYARDGIADWWQVQYFGTNNPAATGPDVLFKYVAGLNPTNTASVFSVSLQATSGQPSIVFSPRLTNRTYTVQYCTDLTTGGFLPLTGAAQTDDGSVRTVADLNATNSSRFYRVQISYP